jgi:hypothetical protein
MKIFAMSLVALAVAVGSASLAHANANVDPAKAKRCAAGFQKCMADCRKIALASTGNASHPQRDQMCRANYCDPAMRQNGCPAQP